MIGIKNKKAIAPFAIAGIFLLIVMAVYLVLFLPIPAFTSLRQTINYFLVLILWFVFQFLIIYGAFKAIQYVGLAYRTYKFKILGWALNVKKYIVSH
jgi:surface polysaccharide O-acyltransferase-like enzyme